MTTTMAAPTARVDLGQGVTATYTELVASVAKDDFYTFVQEFWHTVVPDAPVWNWHIKYLCDELQAAATRVFKGTPKKHDIIINVPPGTTKSTIVSVMFPAWVLANMPAARLICSSHTHDLSLDLSNKCRAIVQSELYRACFPDVRLRDDQNTKSHWATTAGGMRYCCTVGGKSPTGMHGHFILVDDPIDPEKALSEAELRKANRYMVDTLRSRKTDRKITVTVLIMQRLHEDDPTGNWLGRAKRTKQPLHHICLPASLEYPVLPATLAEHYKDGLLDPLRLPKDILDEERGESLYTYAGQYGQSPIPAGGGMFKTDRLVIAPSPPPADIVLRTVRYWDKAGTDKGGAFTVGVSMSKLKDGRYVINHIVRGQWGSDEREATIVQTAKLDGKRIKIGVEQEPGSGGKESAQATARRLAGYVVKLDPVTGSKESRWDTFSTQLNAGNVAIVSGPWVEPFIEELRYLPVGKYKDQADAASGAFNMLTAQKVVGGMGVLEQAVKEEPDVSYDADKNHLPWYARAPHPTPLPPKAAAKSKGRVSIGALGH